MNLYNFIICVVLFAICDSPYLYLNKSLFQEKIREISGRGMTTRYYSGLIVYLALSIGLTIFVLPLIRKDNNENIIYDSILYGGLFGLSVYATFDFTIHIMFSDWNLQVAIMDTLWGGILCSLVSIIISFISKK
jgi:uncharacterized membrane protein